MLLCSNIHLSYANSQGSISRRLAIFKSNRYVLNKNVTLETMIIESELSAILAKCLIAYKNMLCSIGSKSFWDVCPDYFHENIREMSEQTDYIYMFFTLPPWRQCLRRQGRLLYEERKRIHAFAKLQKKVMNYMRFRHPGIKYRWTSDYSFFNRLGYGVKYLHVCKGCGLQARTGCCSSYSVASRSRRYVI